MNRKDFLKKSIFGGIGLSTFANEVVATQLHSHTPTDSSFTISDVKTYIHPKALFVKITTKEGVSGWGEGDHDNTKVIAQIIQQLAKPILMNQDPF
jgi:L-alanine-DL-glutamate epimerase-like enolase superfamily enzyme